MENFGVNGEQFTILYVKPSSERPQNKEKSTVLKRLQKFL